VFSGESDTVRVTVCHCAAPRELFETDVVLPVGGTVRMAIEAAGLGTRFPALDLQLAGAGVWGRRVGPEHCLGDGDRVEVYRPLRVDPKLARRERFRKQGVRAAGLFARRNVGKPPASEGES
jgi:putative ubiquitin-RnfH superfamily antitoxin RatB of RatAB toxin-antitoxin module